MPYPFGVGKFMPILEGEGHVKKISCNAAFLGNLWYRVVT